MLTDAFDILTLPGWRNSGPDNWQSHWEQAFPSIQRVVQDDWDHADYEKWAKCLSGEVARRSRPVILVAHSLGTSLATRWALAGQTGPVAGAFLVAPTDRDTETALANSAITGFSPMALKTLPFPSMVVASSNDPHVSLDRATQFAEAWGSRFINAGPLGHIGASEKLGLWPQGLVLFGQFLADLA
ncbi:alpha/beta hydrolase [Burkholderia sp. Bp8963]|uniref:RBBP9/YdeN family alpha/beta hydrolase n=1 Tax=Burkholderia sp. Bp8963 TaxID=2184547 RepID=UPI000F5A873D|nr:alpha/beta fold hydrolase [Burkholderia sp. Bp8963]RQS63492.1 alpha/beta hydrolase [Burkholderia sp. Bp8963]